VAGREHLLAPQSNRRNSPRSQDSATILHEVREGDGRGHPDTASGQGLSGVGFVDVRRPMTR
jgi:hypothetical protein